MPKAESLGTMFSSQLETANKLGVPPNISASPEGGEIKIQRRARHVSKGLGARGESPSRVGGLASRRVESSPSDWGGSERDVTPTRYNLHRGEATGGPHGDVSSLGALINPGVARLRNDEVVASGPPAAQRAHSDAADFYSVPRNQARRNSVNVTLTQKSRARASRPPGQASPGPTAGSSGDIERARGPSPDPNSRMKMKRRQSLPNAGADASLVRDELQHRRAVKAQVQQSLEQVLLNDEQKGRMKDAADEARRRVKEKIILNKRPTHKRGMSSLTEDSIMAFLEEDSAYSDSIGDPQDSGPSAEHKFHSEVTNRSAPLVGQGALMAPETRQNTRKNIFSSALGDLDLSEALEFQVKAVSLDALEGNALEISRNIYDVFPKNMRPERESTVSTTITEEAETEESRDASAGTIRDEAIPAMEEMTPYFDMEYNGLSEVRDESVMMMPWDPLSKKRDFAESWWERLHPVEQSTLPAYQRLSEGVPDKSRVVLLDILVSRLRSDFINPKSDFVSHGMKPKDAEGFICSQHIDRRLRLAFSCFMNGTVWDTKACVTEYAFRRFLCAFGPFELLFVHGIPLIENQVVHFAFTPVTLTSPSMVTEAVSRRVQNASSSSGDAAFAMSLASNQPFCTMVIRSSQRQGPEMLKSLGLGNKYMNTDSGSQRVIRTYCIANLGYGGWMCETNPGNRTPRVREKESTEPPFVPVDRYLAKESSAVQGRLSGGGSPATSGRNSPALGDTSDDGGQIDNATLVLRMRNRPSVLTPLPVMPVERAESNDSNEDLSDTDQTRSLISAILSGKAPSRADQMKGTVDSVIEQDKIHQMRRRSSVAEIINNVFTDGGPGSSGGGLSPSGSRRNSLALSRRSSRASLIGMSPEDGCSDPAPMSPRDDDGLLSGRTGSNIPAMGSPLRTGRSGGSLLDEMKPRRAAARSFGSSPHLPFRAARSNSLEPSSVPLVNKVPSMASERTPDSPGMSPLMSPMASPMMSPKAGVPSPFSFETDDTERYDDRMSPVATDERDDGGSVSRIGGKAAEPMTAECIETFIQTLVDRGYKCVAEQVAPYYLSSLPPSFTLNADRTEPFISPLSVHVQILYAGAVTNIKFDYCYRSTDQPLKKLNPSIRQAPCSSKVIREKKGHYWLKSDPCMSYLHINKVSYIGSDENGEPISRDYNIAGKYSVHTMVASQRDISYVKMELSLDMAVVFAFSVRLEDLVDEESERFGDDVTNDSRLSLVPLFLLEKHFV